MDNYFMVELDYFDAETYEKGSFEEVIDTILKYFRNSGRLLSLSISPEDAIMWVMLKFDNDDELIDFLDYIPLPYDLSYEFYPIYHYEVIQEMGSFSLN